MPPAVRKLLDEALALSEDDRVALADGIWHSLGAAAQDEMHCVHSMSDPDFRAEIQRRLEEADKHPELLIPWEEVQRNMAERANRTPPQ